MTRAEQLQDQAEFLRSLAASSSISSKRDQLLRAAEHCEALADSLGGRRTRRNEPRIEPAPPGVGAPYLRMPRRRH
jgi:hypothetical protein